MTKHAALHFGILIVLMHSAAAIAISGEALQAEAAITSAENDMTLMSNAGLSVTRYNDTLIAAKQIYAMQNSIEAEGGKPDYSQVYEKIDALNDLKQLAFRTFDEIHTLEATINRTNDIDLAPVLEIYSEAKDDFSAERYEDALKSVDKAYKKISELEAVETKVKAVYEAASRGLMEFLKRNWRNLVIISTAMAIAALISHNAIEYFLLKRKIESLKKRKDSIKKLIAKTQNEYFGEGKMSDTKYYIQTKKYAELIRDIDRQIPLLNEELARREKRVM